VTHLLGTRRPLTDLPGPLVLGSALCLAIATVLVQDQGGLPGHRDPRYLQLLSYAVEAAAVVTIALLTAVRTRVLGWLLALAVGIVPLAGSVLGHAGALPDDYADPGRWTEQLVITGLVVDAALVALSLAALAGSRHRVGPVQWREPYDDREAPVVELVGSSPAAGLAPVATVGPYGVEVETLDVAPVDEIRSPG
jgi:hypothetical protein